ncbi:hypothetical protein HK103_005819 [Boothiomyces macroporosus]|uniref:Uncharacterized protein n=1 Tax=Boothiomyces macroporosus TaxID=261099 RepID=A0AAD5UFE0_9FUNG|nr:hypothetical protein HK103_005819 [Boothiomyces macroporosus]
MENATPTIKLENTVRHMFKREKKREANGHYVKSSSEKLWILFIIFSFLLLIGGMLNVQWLLEKTFFQTNWFQLLLPSSLSVLLLIGMVLMIILKVSLVMRWCLYWISITLVVLMLLDDEQRKQYAKIILFCFIFVESCTVVIYCWIRVLYPALVLYLSYHDPNYWDIQPVSNKLGRYSCKRALGFKSRKAFSYIGSVNNNKQPHGYGKWKSENNTGEVLSGLWYNGIPIGPFRAREYATGYSFTNIRVGFVRTDSSTFYESTFDNLHELQFGVAGVECSISGRFFAGLPNAMLIVDPYQQDAHSLHDCEKQIIHLHEVDDVIRSDEEKLCIVWKKNGFEIEGFEAIHDKKEIVIKHTEEVGKFEIKNWIKSPEGKEALVYIPGFNCPLKSALEALGQMIALGNLPPRIKPFVFSWPGGTLIHYPKATKFAQNDNIQENLIKFLLELKSLGYTKVHLLCHSMGARVVTKFAANIHRVFKKTNDTQDSFKLCDLTFLNPEALLNKFCSEQYHIFREYTDLITIYGSSNDVALRSAEILYVREPLLGCNLNLLFSKNSQSVENDYFDVDAISTTELDMNIHIAHHSYFNLNKFIVDDLIDLLITGKRAKDREYRLVQIEDNIYNFLVAPSYIVN